MATDATTERQPRIVVLDDGDEETRRQIADVVTVLRGGERSEEEER